MTDTNGARSDESGPTPGAGDPASAAPEAAGAAPDPAGAAPDPASAAPDPASAAPGYFKAGPVVMLVIAAVAVIVDQITKVVAVAALDPGRPVELIGETVRLVLIRNPGAAFSMGTGFTSVLSVVAILVVVGLLWFSRRVHSRWWAWGLGLVLGGAAGNLVDRLVRDPGVLRGHVVDFMSVGWWPVFNVADSCLVAGVIVIAVAVLRNIDYDGSRVSDRDSKRVPAATTPGEEKVADG